MTYQMLLLKMMVNQFESLAHRNVVLLLLVLAALWDGIYPKQFELQEGGK
ncbi:hypothetical protein ACNSO8_09520 [Yersinia sp. LJYL362]